VIVISMRSAPSNLTFVPGFSGMNGLSMTATKSAGSIVTS